MPSVESGLEVPGMPQPKPDEQTLDSDEGFRRNLEAKVKDLPANVNDWGAPESDNRRARIAREMSELEQAEAQKIRSREQLHDYMVGPAPGDWRDGIEVPDDAPKSEPSAPSAEFTAELERVKSELTTTKASLSELEQHEAMQLARDELEEAEDEDEVHATLSELREKLPAEQWSAFQMESLGDGLLDPDELSRHENVYTSSQAFDQAQGQAKRAQEEADSLALFQYETLEGEQKRLGLSDEAYTAHLQDVVEAAGQLGYDWDGVSKEGYASEIRRLSALVAAGRSAYRQAAIQEAIVGAPSGSVEEGLTVRGVPVSPREEIEPKLDYAALLRHESIGQKVDIAGAVMGEDAKSRSLGEEADAVFRQAVRDTEAKQARARRAGF